MICPVCHHPAVLDLVNPGPEWGPTHRACFVRVDAEAEALEHLPWLPPQDLDLVAPTCSVPLCGGRVRAGGMCEAHYRRGRRGMPLVPILARRAA